MTNSRGAAFTAKAFEGPDMTGAIASIYRHPVKGFTPERLPSALLEAKAHFPCDRLYAVESGPSGYDPANPRYIAKSRFAVLANTPALARARTRYDEATGVISVELDGERPFLAKLTTQSGRARFAAWLSGFLGEGAPGPLKVLEATRTHRFMDDTVGHVSVVNLESVRDFGRRLGRVVDPLRFRANVYVEGWPAWRELDATRGSTLRLGGVEAEIVKPIIRCAAPDVDTVSGEQDLEVVTALRALYGHAYCGLYLQVASGGRICEGDPAVLAKAHVRAAAQAGGVAAVAAT